MKQNNTNMLFKSLALCFLILGNLTSDILCTTTLPTSSITSTVPVKIVEEKDVAVPTSNVCDAINKHYKMKSKEDFFKKLVKPAEGVAEYKFLFNSKDDGKVILENKIKAAIDEAKKVNSVLTAEDAFKAFTTEVGKIKTDTDNLKVPLTAVTADALQTFMSNFEFSTDKFVLKSAGSAVTLNDIADNLVVYLNCSLDDLKMEVENLAGDYNVLQDALIAAQVNLATKDAAATKAADDAKAAADDADAAADDAKAAADDADAAAAATKAADAAADAKAAAVTASDELATAQKELKTAKNNAIDGARKQAKDAVLSKLITTVTPATSTPTTLENLLDALNKYHIKTEYNYAAAVITTPNTAAEATVKYSIATSAVSAGHPKITSTPLAITAADIDNSKKFLPQFIDTKNALAKDVFVAISAKCTGADANACFKVILSKLKADFEATMKAALSTVVSEKTVTKDEFNKAFKPFVTESDVKVEDKDIGERKIKLCWLSNVIVLGEQFNNYITWLENNNHLQSKEFNDKPAAVAEFFKVLQDNLDEYKKKLEVDLKSAEVKLEEKTDKDKEEKTDKDKETKEKPIVKQPQQSNAQPTPKTGMSKTTKIIIIVGGVVGGFLILSGIGFFTYWYSYSTKSSGVV